MKKQDMAIIRHALEHVMYQVTGDYMSIYENWSTKPDKHNNYREHLLRLQGKIKTYSRLIKKFDKKIARSK